MRGRRGGWNVGTIILATVLVVSCGGDDDSSAPDTSGSAEPTSVPTATAASQSTDPVDATTASAPATSASEPDVADDTGSSSGLPNCDDIFSIAEVEELFAEPATLTENTDDSLGQLVCDWETIEDRNDVTDTGFKLLQVQVYSGSPISASMFFDPSIFEEAVMIDGIGDLAYSSDDLGTSFYFVDEPIGGSLSYTELDMGDLDAPHLRSRADIEALFRTFHDRVT